LVVYQSYTKMHGQQNIRSIETVAKEWVWGVLF